MEPSTKAACKPEQGFTGRLVIDLFCLACPYWVTTEHWRSLTPTEPPPNQSRHTRQQDGQILPKQARVNHADSCVQAAPPLGQFTSGIQTHTCPPTAVRVPQSAVDNVQ